MGFAGKIKPLFSGSPLRKGKKYGSDSNVGG
jgi:hypothetical protein